jgi:hypothetical protein
MSPSVPGVDYSDRPPGGAALAAAGVRFAARYLSHNREKNLTHAEAADLAAHGVACVVVWETTAQRASDGRAAGVTDAREAAAQAAACGMSPSRPVYFAVDYDADPAAVAPYFQGVASVIGVQRTGGYGGYRVIKYLLDHGLITWAWQTVAWSAGRWDPRAHIRQAASTIRIAGVSCDHDTAYQTDYGQWMPGQEDDMPLTAADHKAIAKEVVDELTAPGARDTLAAAVLYWLTRAADPTIALPTGKDAPGAASQTAALRTALTKHNTAAPEIDYAKLAGALLAGIKEG